MAVDSAPRIDRKQESGKNPAASVPIRAWYYNPTDDPPYLPHEYTPNRIVPVEHLKELGVLTWTQIETEDYQTNKFLNNIKDDRGYNYEEVLTVAPGKLNNFEALTKKFFTEHLHEQEEIRFILDGIGYEDVRDLDGQWIRIEIKKGDLIVLPPGMYHRFTLDQNNYLKALLLYQGIPCRIQFDQSPVTDSMEVRKEYLDSVLFCKGNEDEKWKEQSHEEDDSAAASYTPMNSLELTTTNLSFQALTV
ncbi:hypothetical protein BDL97_01G154100 [Sphagnum fallax]|nr:hypothetical protein BDL97_01G154100 [Sphagnum fallax]KAH8975384.1 hypothetical protein BDL97_01G154100 [Sphagnum fallax]KAH8975385.1 hypothetical protein BDL97_01G154100 [Sphagnum fallax]